MRRKNQSFDQYRYKLLDYHGYFLGHFTSSKKIFLSIIGMIVGIASFWNVKKEMKSIEEADSHDNK